jgi:hypothetical protein
MRAFATTEGTSSGPRSVSQIENNVAPYIDDWLKGKSREVMQPAHIPGDFS